MPFSGMVGDSNPSHLALEQRQLSVKTQAQYVAMSLPPPTCDCPECSNIAINLYSIEIDSDCLEK